MDFVMLAYAVQIITLIGLVVSASVDFIRNTKNKVHCKSFVEILREKENIQKTNKCQD